MKRAIPILFCITAVILFIYYLTGRTGNLTHGFASYYTFSRLLLEEEDFSKAYDTAYFNIKIQEYGIENVRDLPNNVPTSAIMLVPVAKMQPAGARIAWIVLSVIFYIISILILLNVYNVKLFSTSGLLLSAVSFLFLPMYHCMALGQAYVFLLLLFSIRLYGLKKSSVWVISIPLALMIVLKGYGIFPLISLFLLKKYREAFIAILISVIVIIITLPVTGTEAWSIYFSNVLMKMGSNPFASYTAYQTAYSFISHVTGTGTFAAVILLLLILSAYGIILIKKIHVFNAYTTLLFYCSFAVLNVMFAPLAEDYHYTLLLPLVFGTGIILIKNYKDFKFESTVFIISLLLISIPSYYKSLNDASFPLILLAYPVLYGGAVFLLISFSRKLLSFTRQAIEDNI